MKHVLYLSFVIFVFFDLAGQQQDTIELISTEELRSDHLDLLMPIDESDKAFLDSKEYKLKKLDNNLYCWSNNTEKQIQCSGDVKIYKLISKKITQSFCLACIIDNKLFESNGCISLSDLIRN